MSEERRTGKRRYRARRVKTASDRKLVKSVLSEAQKREEGNEESARFLNASVREQAMERVDLTKQQIVT